jgi:hypothetical protein
MAWSPPKFYFHQRPDGTVVAVDGDGVPLPSQPSLTQTMGSTGSVDVRDPWGNQIPTYVPPTNFTVHYEPGKGPIAVDADGVPLPSQPAIQMVLNAKGEQAYKAILPDGTQLQPAAYYPPAGPPPEAWPPETESDPGDPGTEGLLDEESGAEETSEGAVPAAEEGSAAGVEVFDEAAAGQAEAVAGVGTAAVEAGAIEEAAHPTIEERSEGTSGESWEKVPEELLTAGLVEPQEDPAQMERAVRTEAVAATEAADGTETPGSATAADRYASMEPGFTPTAPTATDPQVPIVESAPLEPLEARSAQGAATFDSASASPETGPTPLVSEEAGAPAGAESAAMLVETETIVPPLEEPAGVAAAETPIESEGSLGSEPIDLVESVEVTAVESGESARTEAVEAADAAVSTGSAESLEPIRTETVEVAEPVEIAEVTVAAEPVETIEVAAVEAPVDDGVDSGEE